MIGKEEENEVKDVFDNGAILFRHGFESMRSGCYKVKDFENEFGKFVGREYALAVTSGTAALRVALASLGLGPGDEVITQCFTFVATVEAIIEAGAKPKCVDIDQTLNMCPKALEKAITPRTKAVIVVHMLGTPAKLEELNNICKKNSLFLIEDTAWGCGGSLQKKALGTWGDIGTYSFDFAKTMTTGEGGMVVFKDKKIYEKAFAWHDHGHENNPNFPRWEDTRSSNGFNYRMMELQGAIGLAQLRKLKKIVQMQRDNKRQIWNSISHIEGIIARQIPPESYETADALIFQVNSSELAIRCREELLKVGLSTKILPEAYTWHFAGTWEHMESLLESHEGNLNDAFDQSKDLLKRAVSIPISVYMNREVPMKVAKALEAAMSIG